jgi:Ser/Thr protein kinase RdoA (MazF antagonist)
MTELPAPLSDLLAAYRLPSAFASAERATSGLIQTTYLVKLADGTRVVAQKTHPVFDPDGTGEALLGDIDAITAHLDASGLETPRLLRRAEASLGWRDAEGKLWRLMTWLPGTTHDRVSRPSLASEAAKLCAHFHAALAPLPHVFAFSRPGAHDTAAHLLRLEAHTGDPDAPDEVRALADAILAEATRRPALPPELPARITHGDLKISNVLFADDGTAHALIDLDTLGRLTLAYELGDALRSWCNPLGEDVVDTHFDLDVFAAAVHGYAEGAAQARFALAPGEPESLVPGLVTVALELSSRFCTDAFEDRYFGWNPARFASRREHNRVRAAGQLALARAVLARRGEAEALCARVFSRPGSG